MAQHHQSLRLVVSVASGEVGSPVHLLQPCGRRMQQEARNTLLSGEPFPARGTDSLVETEEDGIASSLLLGRPLPELLTAPRTSGLVLLADLHYV